MMQIFKTLLALALFASPQAFAAYSLPGYEKLTLENGLTLYLMEQDEVPLIDINLVVKAGAVNDGGKAGLTRITAENLVLGTQRLSKAELDEKLDFIGADIYSSANLEFSKLGASFASKDKNTVLPILRDILLSPRFEQAEFDKYKKRHLLQIEQAKESPKSVIGNYFNRLVFGDKGYGSLSMGEEATVSAITLADVKKHHSTWYQPDNAALIMVGDFDSQKVKAELKQLFGQWQKTKALPKTSIPKATKHQKSNVLLVNKEDAGETTFLIGGQGITRSNPDIVGISVINTILGGRFTSWLNDALRVNAGLTYGARSRFASYSQDGSFSISTFTRTETTIEAIDLALATYTKLWEKGIDKETLASAKAYVKGQFPPKFETSEQLADLLVQMYGYGFDESYINTFEQQVNSLTVEKTQKLIQQYFPRDKLQFVLIGKADDIREQVAKYGNITETNISNAMLTLN